jgi:hypothetical protein
VQAAREVDTTGCSDAAAWLVRTEKLWLLSGAGGLLLGRCWGHETDAKQRRYKESIHGVISCLRPNLQAAQQRCPSSRRGDPAAFGIEERCKERFGMPKGIKERCEERLEMPKGMQERCKERLEMPKGIKERCEERLGRQNCLQERCEERLGRQNCLQNAVKSG